MLNSQKGNSQEMASIVHAFEYMFDRWHSLRCLFPSAWSCVLYICHTQCIAMRQIKVKYGYLDHRPPFLNILFAYDWYIVDIEIGLHLQIRSLPMVFWVTKTRVPFQVAL